MYLWQFKKIKNIYKKLSVLNSLWAEKCKSSGDYYPGGFCISLHPEKTELLFDRGSVLDVIVAYSSLSELKVALDCLAYKIMYL